MLRINNFVKLLLLLSVLLLVGCAPVMTTKGTAFPKMYQQKPLTILALPAINTTSSPLAKGYIVCTISGPVTNNGYYLIPTEISDEILKNEGLYDTETIQPTLYPKFKELFNADALLFTKIFKWDTSYYVIGGNVTVGLNYSLVSTATGDTLWSYSGVEKIDTTQATDYIPIARDLNYKIFNTIPDGSYSPRFNLDQNDQLVK